MTWTLSVLDLVCGNCLRAIPAGQPVCLLGVPQRARCAACAAAHGFYPDAQELDLEQFRLEQDVRERRRREDAQTLASARSRPLGRVTPPRPPTPFTQLDSLVDQYFDPRAAAAGDREDR